MTAHDANSGGSRWVLWLPGLIVALGAAAATAHGLFEVAVAARVPTPIAWIYPLITDGLAVVAYTATARLTGSARGYAWAVVVLSAGLSGLAQAVFLASDVPPAALGAVAGEVGGLAVPGALRFGIGAWPAIAAALAAHLLHLLAADPNPTRSTTASSAAHGGRSDVQPPVQSSAVSVQHVPLNSSEHRSTRSISDPDALTAPLPVLESAPGRTPERDELNDADAVVTPFIGRAERSPIRGAETPARDRALAAAARLAARNGALPTVSEVEAEAGVSRGTAATVLKTLRDHPHPSPHPRGTAAHTPDTNHDTEHEDIQP
ncbi:MAG: hypothetical protein ABT15_33085 [Pseudonocardia sp. SCN 73-27]|uniref:hypothetical protein n=1 Tax=unclassified Pseudonocardia TaxID=2619320 RepID=UPI00086E45CB|nr:MULTISPECIES: hypothetical protein [unclassified Pseudonocardia]ODU23384.1 MAG: hypothetical protein ABS80_15085 [Pseudonocardia sp. SCN 72-51]ODU98677.1 MAG: hypothetical protein ABT15_33085 [Pseudonocardia sp. SCN 73-27]